HKGAGACDASRKHWHGNRHPHSCALQGSAGRRSKITELFWELKQEIFMAELTNSGAQSRPNPNEKLVKVFDSEAESEALVVKGLLDSAGIDSDLTSASLVQDAFPGLGGMVILVREGDAEAARKAIAERQPLQDDD